jgi:hypothetical protein
MAYEDVSQLFKHLTGRDPTPEDEEEARRLWEQLETEEEAEDGTEAAPGSG